MCLTENYELTSEFKSKHENILVYKVLGIKDGKFYSPYQESLVEINPDTLEFSTRSSLRASSLGGFWNEGIHAYLDKEAAIEDLKSWRNEIGCTLCDSYEVVRAWIRPRDIFAVGERDDIVARRIFFHQEDVCC